MPLDVLLMTALSSERHFSDAGARLSMTIDPKLKETALFFKMDKAEVRQGLKIQTMLCCDGLIFYSRDNEQDKVFCLVELKGNKLEHAVKQIVTTRDYLQQALAQTLASSYLKRIRWKAYIYQHGSSQREQIKLYRTQLENVYGFDRGHTEISRNSDIGDFLRK